MEKVEDILRVWTSLDVHTSFTDIAIFLGILIGFFVILITAGVLQRKREQRRVSRALTNKWDTLCRIYELTDEEIALLKDISRYLKNPEKKYLLLANYQAFHDSLTAYGRENKIDSQLLDSITSKTKMGQTEKLVSELPPQRRKSRRKPVQLPAYVAAIDHYKAHIHTKMYDLSRGGCKIENPSKHFHQGDDIKISFEFREKNFENIPGEVVRTSSFGRVLHVSFGHVY